MPGLLAQFENLASVRTRLRRLEHGDLDSVFAMFSDRDAMRYWSSPPMSQISEAREWLEKTICSYETASGFQMGVERESDGALLGTFSLFNFHEDCRRAEVGYMLAREYWGQGYMSEIVGAVIDHAFGDVNLNRLEADIDPRNAASAKLLTRMGFHEEGCLRERWIVADEVSDTAIYGLIRGDWLESKS